MEVSLRTKVSYSLYPKRMYKKFKIKQRWMNPYISLGLQLQGNDIVKYNYTANRRLNSRWIWLINHYLKHLTTIKMEVTYNYAFIHVYIIL